MRLKFEIEMRFLVDSGYALGDCAIDVALLRAVSRAGHHVEVLAGDAVTDMFIDCPFVNRVHAKKRSVFSRAAMYWRLFRQNWDVIINTRFVPKGKPVNIIRCRHRLSSANAKPELSGQGAVLWRLSIIEGLIPDWQHNIDASIPFAASRRQSAEKALGIEAGQRLLSVAPGSGRPEKIWPAANFAAVVNSIKHQFDRVVVVGSGAEREMCAQLAKDCDAINCVGRLNLAQTCALVSSAALHLGNDSGLGHIAAGNGVATLAVGLLKEYDKGHYVPWHQHMIEEAVADIEPPQVLAVLQDRFDLSLHTSGQSFAEPASHI